MDYRPPGSFVLGILQARIMEWVAVTSSRGSSRPRDRIPVHCIAGRFFAIWATKEAHRQQYLGSNLSSACGWPWTSCLDSVSLLSHLWDTSAYVWRRRWHPTLVLLPGESHGWRRLVDCSPWGCEELDMTEQLPFQFSLSCIGESDGNSLQRSCLENPRDGGAWWAAVYGVTQSRTRLKRLSSSSSAYVIGLSVSIECLNIFEMLRTMPDT